MSETREGKGQCLCGAVTFTTQSMSQHVGACHCKMCRRWGGAPFMEVDCGDDVTFSGEDNIKIFDSSEWAERGFCQNCGTNLFYRLKETQQHMMAVGLFDDETGLTFDHQVFVDEKPDHYSFANKTEDMTGAEVFAKYAPPED